jgi:hypothetical protein
VPEFEFVDELPEIVRSSRTRANPILMRFAQALRDNPNQWAKYPRKRGSRASCATTARNINGKRHGCPIAFRDAGFEAENRGGICYVRFVGDA